MTTDTTFRAAVVRTPAGPGSIELLDLPVRDPGPGQVRVRVAAASVNPVDLAVAGGFFHGIGLIDQPERTGLGWDFSGTVEAVGDGVDLPVGTRVAGLVGGLDRDFGTYAEQLVVPVADVGLVPDGLDLVAAATFPLNALTAAQLVDLLGDGAGRTLLVTGAAGAVGGYVAPMAAARGWRVTGLARATDEDFVRGLGVDFTASAEPGWDAVADGAVLQEAGVALVRDGGVFVGVQPSNPPASERGVDVKVVGVVPDGRRTTDLLADAAAGRLVTRIAGELPLAEAAEAQRQVAKGGVRGRWVLRP
ncbi:NADP-dependent oxidoreductase [Nocardioides mangrovi]|uniref:NADP-dependent oxidoreductase n=1 Tax=Nocardioides mangrovi TaxID=2874580 RepID=A0ABS7UJM4_9ACTN|nr:NADP-dependent oxidoreductase [Nocardioides mangrovi]MBZ5740990.1 NADP-dependent oxidoreductase [Nocardioides mangrovi]